VHNSRPFFIHKRSTGGVEGWLWKTSASPYFDYLKVSMKLLMRLLKFPSR
jgi:hypothetical protein